MCREVIDVNQLRDDVGCQQCQTHEFVDARMVQTFVFGNFGATLHSSSFEEAFPVKRPGQPH